MDANTGPGRIARHARPCRHTGVVSRPRAGVEIRGRTTAHEWRRLAGVVRGKPFAGVCHPPHDPSLHGPCRRITAPAWRRRGQVIPGRANTPTLQPADVSTRRTGRRGAPRRESLQAPPVLPAMHAHRPAPFAATGEVSGSVIAARPFAATGEATGSVMPSRVRAGVRGYRGQGGHPRRQTQKRGMGWPPTTSPPRVSSDCGMRRTPQAG